MKRYSVSLTKWLEKTNVRTTGTKEEIIEFLSKYVSSSRAIFWDILDEHGWFAHPFYDDKNLKFHSPKDEYFLSAKVISDETSS